MSESKTSKRLLKAVERQRMALELRAVGKSFPAIAVELGYRGPAGAYKAVMSALRRTLQEPADEVRKLELDRLDELMTFLWPEARLANYKAIDGILGIMGRRAKLLGLDAPLNANVNLVSENPFDGKSIDELDAYADLLDRFAGCDLAFLEQVSRGFAPSSQSRDPGGNGEGPATD